MNPDRAGLKIRTDETLRETVAHGTNAFPFQYYYDNLWDYDFHCVDWHWHPEFEALLVEDGSAVCYVGADRVTLEKGQGMLVGSRVLHKFEALEGPAIVPNIVFSPGLFGPQDGLIYQKYVKPLMNQPQLYQVFSPETAWQGEALRFLQEVFSAQDQQPPDELRIVEKLLAFWGAMVPHLLPARDAAQEKHADANQNRLLLMMRYIQEHYREQITLDDIAACVFISKSSAMQIFSRGIQQSPFSYLIRYRLNKAAHLLSATEKKIAAIAAETGFASSGYFCRRFKALYGVRPLDYRRGERPLENNAFGRPQNLL